MTFLPKTYEYNTSLEKIRRVFDFQSGKKLKILDVACGDGRISEPLVLMGHEVYGVDHHADAVQACLEKGIDCRQADITKDLPLLPDFFDIVLALDILEHLEKPEVLLQRLKKIMKQDARLIISVPNHFDIRSRFRILFGKGIVHWAHKDFQESQSWNYQHIRFFRIDELEALLKFLGFFVSVVQFNFMTGGIIPRRFTPSFVRKKLLQYFPRLFSGKFVLLAQRTPVVKKKYIYLPSTPKIF